MKTLSIIIPVYNAENTLQQCIDSILDQDFIDFELILIDDGSKDSSLNICREYEQKDNRIRVISKENGGVSSARNRGIDEAKGQWITFVDADDYIEQGYLRNIKDADADLIIKNYKYLHSYSLSANQIEIYMDVDMSDSKEITEFISNNLATMVFRGPCHKFYKKELIGNIRFNEKMKVGEDSCFVFDYLKQIKSINILPDAAYIIRTTDVASNVKYSCSTEYAIKSLTYLFHSYIELQKVFPITSESFLSYLGYFKLISKNDWKKKLSKWYKNEDVKHMYNFIWIYLPIKQRLEYRILSNTLIRY